MSKYPHVVRLVAEEPWAILPSKLVAIMEVVALRAGGKRLTDDEIVERLAALPRPEPRPAAPPTVAVLPLHGSLVPRADFFSRASGATSMESFGGLFRAAVGDARIDAILIDVDSPGGTVRGTPELAALVYGARGTKPIVAIANTLATSGALWVASQADEFVSSPSAMLGSVGVVTVHQSLARALEMEGIDVTMVRSGRFKAETSPFEPLSDEALAHLQSASDEAYEQFVADVARGRAVSAEKVRNDFGEGRVLSAEAALQAGMIDRIETFEGAVDRLLSPADAGTGGGASRSFVDEAAFAHDAVVALVHRTSSLAEVGRGRLTAAKREQVKSVLAALDSVTRALDELLAQTTPKKHVVSVLNELVRFEALRADQHAQKETGK